MAILFISCGPQKNKLSENNLFIKSDSGKAEIEKTISAYILKKAETVYSNTDLSFA